MSNVRKSAVNGCLEVSESKSISAREIERTLRISNHSPLEASDGAAKASQMTYNFAPISFWDASSASSGAPSA